MAFLTTIQQSHVADLHSLRYRDWPAEARGLARVVIGRPGGLDELLSQLDRKDWLISQVERLHQQNRSIAEWLGET